MGELGFVGKIFILIDIPEPVVEKVLNSRSTSAIFLRKKTQFSIKKIQPIVRLQLSQRLRNVKEYEKLSYKAVNGSLLNF